ncbi:hypothetical protein [Cronobacter muytjensii]|uniref:hypothetical protein n=1 Tax=Cronobacter muytjensii TaxID=413501 RepID=UPI003CF0F0B2
MTVIKSHSEAGRISATALAEFNATRKATAAVILFIPMINLYVLRWLIAEEQAAKLVAKAVKGVKWESLKHDIPTHLHKNQKRL